MSIFLHQHDLPSYISFGKSVAIDTETRGLKLTRDRLCLVQLSDGNGEAHLVQISAEKHKSPYLEALLQDKTVEKLFHFARFDLAVLTRDVCEVSGPIYCTKIASKLSRTYTDRHGLKDLCSELLSVELSKQQQSSDWGAEILSEAQKKYAASDVLYLHRLKAKLNEQLKKEGRLDLAHHCFDFLTHRVTLDLGGFEDLDIFHH
ncbi:MAG: ribonuclease D [Alphaproteobacteria bacterium]|jgi:ribonuclease D|nr:ribonuclease D [Alphaproteobacteria bacterium]